MSAAVLRSAPAYASASTTYSASSSKARLWVGRVLTTLLYALKHRSLRRGIATLCLGGGNGVALAIET